MTKVDFSFPALKPILVAAIIFARPDGLSASLGTIQHYVLGVSMLGVPFVLLLLSSKRAG
jgi:hypothetical protein